MALPPTGYGQRADIAQDARAVRGVRKEPASIIIYEETSPLFFHLNYTFTSPQDYLISGINKVCENNEIRGRRPFSAICLVEQYLNNNLGYFSKRLEAYYQATTNQPAPKLVTNHNRLKNIVQDYRFTSGAAILPTTTTTSAPVDSESLESAETTITPRPTTPEGGYLNASRPELWTTATPSEEPLELQPAEFNSQESLERSSQAYLDRLGSTRAPTRQGRSINNHTWHEIFRPKRQAGLIGLGIGYIGAHLFNYIDPPTPQVDYKAMYKSLVTSSDEQGRNVVKIADAVKFEHHHIDSGLSELYTHFSYSMQRDKHQFEDFQKSVHDGNLRMYLLIARLSEDAYRLMELEQYSKIMGDCAAGKLSSAEILPKALSSELLKVQDELAKADRELAIPTGQLSAYYHHELVRCSINSGTGEIDIRLEIPIRVKNRKMELAEIFSVPFYHQSKGQTPQICHLAHTHDLVLLIEDTSFIINSADQAHCQIERGISQVFPYGTTTAADVGCIRSLLTEQNQEDPSRFEKCPFKCRAAGTTEVSVVKLGWQKGFYQFAMTAPPKNSHLLCVINGKKSTYELLPSSSPVIGTLLTEIPCGCIINLGNTHPAVKLPVPCMTGGFVVGAPTINIIIPGRWARFNTTQVQQASQIDQTLLVHKGYDQFDEAFNHTWNGGDLVLNLTKITHPDVTSFEEKFGFYHHALFSGIAIIWLVFVSGVCVFLMYKNHQTAQQLLVILSLLPSAKAAIKGTQLLSTKYIFSLLPLRYLMQLLSLL